MVIRKVIVTRCPGSLKATNLIGNTPFHIAAQHGKEDILIELLDHLDDDTTLDKTNCNDDNALHCAIKNEFNNCATLLMRKHITTTISQNKSIMKAISLAVQNNTADTLHSILNNLREVSEFNLKEPELMDLLKIASNTGSQNCLEVIIEYCLIAPVKIDIPVSKLILQATRRGHLECIKVLLKRYPDTLSTQDTYGNTLLHIAISEKKHSIVTFLLEKNRDFLFVRNAKGFTPLHEVNHKETMKVVYPFLIKKTEERQRESNRPNDSYSGHTTTDDLDSDALRELVSIIRYDHREDLYSNERLNLIYAMAAPNEKTTSTERLRSCSVLIFWSVFNSLKGKAQDEKSISQPLSKMHCNALMHAFHDLFSALMEDFSESTAKDKMLSFLRCGYDFETSIESPQNQDSQRTLTCIQALLHGYFDYHSSKSLLQPALDLNPCTSGLRVEDFHKFFLDAGDVAMGKFYYEDESGAHAAINLGFHYILTNLVKKNSLSFDDIQAINSIQCETIRGRDGKNLSRYIDLVKKEPYEIGFYFDDHHQFSIDGIQEILARYAEGDFLLIIRKTNSDSSYSHIPFSEFVSSTHTVDLKNKKSVEMLLEEIKGVTLGVFGLPVETERRKKVEYHIDIFNKEMSDAKSNSNKIMAIAKLCRNLELVHYFTDFNGRTNSILLMNGLLIREGLSPCTSDSGIVWRQSVNELYNLMTRWQKKARQLITSRQ